MSEPFLGEIRPFAFPFAPRGWAACDGQIMNIAQNQALFSIMGTTYGGNGSTTFGLPDLRGRVPISWNSAYPLGRAAGEQNHTIISGELPGHTHQVMGSTNTPTVSSPAGNVWATQDKTYFASGDTAMSSAAISTAGEGQGHPNMQPYLPVNFCIALEGIYPSRN